MGSSGSDVTGSLSSVNWSYRAFFAATKLPVSNLSTVDWPFVDSRILSIILRFFCVTECFFKRAIRRESTDFRAKTEPICSSSDSTGANSLYVSPEDSRQHFSGPQVSDLGVGINTDR